MLKAALCRWSPARVVPARAVDQAFPGQDILPLRAPVAEQPPAAVTPVAAARGTGLPTGLAELVLLATATAAHAAFFRAWPRSEPVLVLHQLQAGRMLFRP